jgi:Domain of unknown function (DUF397)
VEDTTDLKWRKSTYSSNGGGECVEVADQAGRVLVRDTKDRSGPVLSVSAEAWRRFAGQVKRALARPWPGPADACRGALVSRVPLCRVLGRDTSVSSVIGAAGTIVLAVSSVIGTSGTVMHAPSVVIRVDGTGVLAPSSIIGAARTRSCFWGGRKGVWGETWNRAAWGARGGSGFPPSDFQSPFPCCLLLTEQSWSVPDLALLLFEGVRSGTRRRRGPGTSPQAARGTGQGTRRTVPAPTGTVLYGRWAGRVAGLCGAGGARCSERGARLTTHADRRSTSAGSALPVN